MSLAWWYMNPTTYVAHQHLRRSFSDLMEHAILPPQLSLSLRKVNIG